MININSIINTLGKSQGLAQLMRNIHVKASALSSRNHVDSKCQRIYIFGRNDVESLLDSLWGTLVPDPSGRLLKSKVPNE